MCASQTAATKRQLRAAAPPAAPPPPPPLPGVLCLERVQQRHDQQRGHGSAQHLLQEAPGAAQGGGAHACGLGGCVVAGRRRSQGQSWRAARGSRCCCWGGEGDQGGRRGLRRCTAQSQGCREQRTPTQRRACPALTATLPTAPPPPLRRLPPDRRHQPVCHPVHHINLLLPAVRPGVRGCAGGGGVGMAA